jgi:hypothetical protein
MADDVRFRSLFEGWAGRVRGRLAVRRALTGVAVGAAVAALCTVVAWQTRHGSPRLYGAMGASAAFAGLAVGLVVARRRRWTNIDVALYLDDRLQAEEAITTAVELRGRTGNAAEDPVGVAVVSRAAQALASEDTRRARPTVLRPVQALAPVAGLVLVLVARAPLPPVPHHAEPPGAARVQLAQVEGLQKAIVLSALDARDEGQRARLDKIAKDAAKLKEQLAAGMQKRDAQDKIASLRDQIAAERLSLGDGQHRAGLESAVAKLAEHEATKRAAKALGDHDLTAMDAQMEKLANEREAADREAAKHALDEAAETARQNGAADVAGALEDQKSSLGKRARRADVLRELGDAMKSAGKSSEELQSESESLDREGSDAAARKLADSMRKALEKLTPEERSRLAKKLAEQAASKGVSHADADSLKDLSSELGSQEGQQRLEDELKEMAKEDATSAESRRQQALDDAQRGAAGAEGQVGKQGQGQQHDGKQGQQGGAEGEQGQQGEGEGQGEGEAQGQGKSGGPGTAVPIPGSGGPATGGPGHGGSHDTGTGSHVGKTEPVAADTLRSRAKGPLNKSSAMPGSVTSYTSGRSGGTANTRGTGDLKIVGPGEVDGVERNDVPQEYRDHVRQYFQP